MLVIVGNGDGSLDDRESEWKNDAYRSGVEAIFTGHLTGLDLIARLCV